VEVIETERLFLRRPRAADAPAIFARYASDPEVTRYLSWPTHRSLDDTHAFISFSDELWSRWPIGPYQVFGKDGVTMLGAAGLVYETPYRAATGYVFAQDAWGRGYATEALEATVACARKTAVRRIQAGVHCDHRPSRRVLEKAGFTCEGLMRAFSEFPNLRPGEPCDVFSYALVF
jgi:ribosomal-protein-alanine N-acetyltransferase